MSQLQTISAAQRLVSQTVSPESGTAQIVNPFPGLRPFGPKEAHLFFGREQHTEEVLKKLTRQRLTTVIGTSGSGKSSLVFAGVVPRLYRGYKVGTVQTLGRSVSRSSWRVTVMRPGGDPLQRLASALHRANDDQDQEEHVEAPTVGASEDDALQQGMLEAQLRRSQQGLVEACKSLQLAPTENLLLIVDQFEELFRFRALSRQKDRVRDPAAQFVRLLLKAAEQTEIPIYVMLTMRADFVGDCVLFSGLAEAINEGQFLLPLLNRDQREQVIRGPMAVVESKIAPALVQRLLNDAGDMTDQLPVMQHALSRSFELWQADVAAEPRLSLGHYRLAGEMRSALNKHANEALDDVREILGEEGVRVTQRLFRSLTQQGAERQGIRRPCEAREVLEAADTNMATLQAVVEHFSRKRRGFVVVQPAGNLTPNSIIDISHEALMRVWHKLSEWSAAEFDFANQLRYLNDACCKREQGVAGLWGDPELSLALQWMKQSRPTEATARRYGVELKKVEQFLKDSARAQEAVRATAEDARTWRRFRKMFSRAKTSSLMALLALPLVLLIQGSGIIDTVLPMDTRLKLFSVPARYLGMERQVHKQLTAVVIDATTEQHLRSQERHGQAIGPLGASWRELQAELLTQLSQAGAAVVAYDISFGHHQEPSRLVRAGTEAFAAAIVQARRRGTAVVIAAGSNNPQGQLDTDPTIQAALTATGNDLAGANAAGHIANPCIGIAKGSGAVTVPLLTTRKGRAHQPGLALAAYSSFHGMSNLFVDWDDNIVVLFEKGRQLDVPFAGLGRPVELKHTRAEGGCEALTAGDIPAQRVIDIAPGQMHRGDPGVLTFEDVIRGQGLEDISGQLVMVGAQLFHPLRAGQPRRMRDVHSVLQCEETPWSCGSKDRWGLNLHLDAVNSLLLESSVVPVSALTQLLLIMGLCAAVAWLRLRNRGRSARVVHGGLLALCVLDIAIIVGAALWEAVLMDGAYHLLAMIATHLVVGRLDRHEVSTQEDARWSATPSEGPA